MSDSEVLISRNGISYSAKRVDLILAHFDDAKYFLDYQRKYEGQSKLKEDMPTSLKALLDNTAVTMFP
jgi:hypothetical protein